MCFHAQQTKSAAELENRFHAHFKNKNNYSPAIYNGFTHPHTPVITNEASDKIQLFQWGLIPFWAKDSNIQKHTLNARIETLSEKPSFRNVVNNRCLILADGFFEWQWLDTKGKQKQKYLITLPNESSFAFAGLYSTWVDKQTGEIKNTYTIITTQANELMSKIHNTKKRMPVILNKEDENNWLKGKQLEETEIELKAISL